MSNTAPIQRSWMRNILACMGFGCCVCLLLASADRGACFGTGTTVTLTLSDTTVYRDAWEAAYGRYVTGLITVSQHGLWSQNEIKLQGHRTGTLWEGENYWSMNTAWIYFSYYQTSGYHNFPFGPPCLQPDDHGSWTQIYRYTATIWAGNTYNSDTEDFNVINENY